jgi:hypothetical protein
LGQCRQQALEPALPPQLERQFPRLVAQRFARQVVIVDAQIEAELTQHGDTRNAPLG